MTLLPETDKGKAILAGLVCMGGGLALVWPPLGLIAIGAFFLLVGMVAPPDGGSS